MRRQPRQHPARCPRPAVGTSGNMTQSQVSPDGSYSISTVVAGRPDVSAFYNSGGTGRV
jgi:hypothetical protein